MIVPSEQQQDSSAAMAGGKAHPGPRAFFACDVVAGTNKVVLWGGVDPAGKFKGDGWLLDMATPSMTGMLKNVPGVGKFVKGDDV